jgi:hypothetical protein
MNTDRRTFLQLLSTGALSAVFPPSISRALSIPAYCHNGTINDVQHIVFMMQENRSFDQGLSNVETTNEIFPGSSEYPTGPYGMGVRVPMVVISPWSKGGWVNSQVFDHTSLIRFIERRFGSEYPGIMESNITKWRRQSRAILPRRLISPRLTTQRCRCQVGSLTSRRITKSIRITFRFHRRSRRYRYRNQAFGLRVPYRMNCMSAQGPISRVAL